MKKLLLLIFGLAISNMVFGNEYKAELKELNDYLSKFDNQNYVEISVKDNVLYCLFGDYEDASAKISDIFDAEVDYVKKKVYLRCYSGNCVHYSLTNDYKSYFSFSTSTGKDLEKLTNLINNFLAAYRGKTVKTDVSSDDYLDYFLYDMFVGEEGKESKPATNNQSTNSTTSSTLASTGESSTINNSTSPKSTSIINSTSSNAALVRGSIDSKEYTTALNQLNEYMKTFDKVYYGSFKVDGGYLIGTFKSGDYSKSKISSLDKAVEATPNNKVIIQCKNGEACAFSTFTNSNHSQLSLSQSSSFKTSELIDLINNFLAAYNSK